MRTVTGPRLLLLPALALAFACASPKSAEAPAQEANADQSPMPAAEQDIASEEVGGAPAAAAPISGKREAARDDDSPAEPGGDKNIGASSQLEIKVPMLNGGLNRDIIRRTASDHADDIRGCHGRALAAMPELAGTIVVALTIDADGHVSEAKLGDTSNFASRDAEDCVLALAQGWEFPSPRGGEASVELAFELNPN